MSNPDTLGKVDKALRPVLKELRHFPWILVEACCAGHKPEDSLWLEVAVLGASGLNRLAELLRIIDSKLGGTDIHMDCLFAYTETGMESVGLHGWIYMSIEVFWLPRAEWRRSQ